MPDFRVAETAPEHPKLRAVGLAAFGLWAAAGAYSMRELTDGWVPEYWVQTWPSGKRSATALVTVGLWRREPRHGIPGYQFHDWTDYQRSAAQVRKERAEGKDRARRSRERSAERSALRSPERSGEPVGNGTDLLTSNHPSYSPVTPDPLPTNGASHERSGSPLPAETSERSPERSPNVRAESHDSLSLSLSLSSGLVGGEGSGRARATTQTAPRPRCLQHSQLPADADVPPCRGCQRLRIESEQRVADNVLGELAERTERRAAIDACPHCDDRGMREVGDALARCNHPTLEAVS